MGNTTTVDDDMKQNDQLIKKQKNTEIFTKFKSTDKFSKEIRLKCSPIPQSIYKEHASNKEEVLLLGPNIDRRIRAPSNMRTYNNKQNQVYNIVLLTGEFDNTAYSGTGVIIQKTLNILYILTCAHNVIQIDPDDLNDKTEATKVEFTITQNILNNKHKELASYAAEGYIIHPEYFKKPTPGSGNDIAIIKAIIDPNDKLLNGIKPVKLRTYQSNLLNISNKAKVIGFPGDIDKRCQLYGMSGNYKYAKDNTVITYNNIDTTAGQSGSPVFFCNDNDQKSIDKDIVMINNNNNNNNNIFIKFDEIIGIHTGGKTKKKNWGTALNDEKLKWISDILTYSSISQPDYICNAILICSNPSYNKYMDQMHQTFNRSKVINPKKIYFDNTDGIIDKTAILNEINKTFSDAFNSNKTVIICYVGESNNNGNWIINKFNTNQVETILLKDIIATMFKTYYRKHLFIITDCSHSENWIIEANNFSNNGWITIQASALKNEVAKPGMFMAKYSYSCLQWWKTGIKWPQIAISSVPSIGILAYTLVWDNGIKRIYNLSQASTPVAKKKYSGKQYDSVIIGKTNDGYYRIQLLLVNSWTDMETNETQGNYRQYVGFGVAGNC